MKKFFILFIFIYGASFGQKLKKADNAILNGLKAHINALADDKMEGRRTGTPGEKMAYNYIMSQYKTIGLVPKGDSNGFIQQFEINEGRQVNPSTYFIINGNDLTLEKDFYPLAFSGTGALEAAPVIALQEKGMPWFWDIKELIEKNKA